MKWYFIGVRINFIDEVGYIETFKEHESGHFDQIYSKNPFSRDGFINYAVGNLVESTPDL